MFSLFKNRWWLAVLVASVPLTYFLSAYLIRTYDPNVHLSFSVDREMAIDRARRYAQEVGVDVTNWQAGCKIQISNDLFLYFRAQQNQAQSIADARRPAPEAFLQVRFISPDNQEKLDVFLNTDGQPLGFERKIINKENSIDTDEATARALAQQTFAQTSANLIGWTTTDTPTQKEERNFSNVIRRYTFQSRNAQFPELELKTEISILGETVIGRVLSAKVEPEYAKKNLLNHRVFIKILTGLYWLMVLVITLYGLYRYMQRTRQREVPHARSILLSVISALIFLFFAFQTDFHIFNMNNDTSRQGVVVVIIILTSVLFLLMGMFFGIAYGSGEGDIREAYPGKLTSLDVLLTGRIFSRNVARSFCLGCGIGGLSLLLRLLVWLPWAHRPDGMGLAERSFSIFFGNSTILTPFLTAAYHGLIASVFGLLLPLSFLHKRVRSPYLFWFILSLLSLSVSFDMVQDRFIPLIPTLLQGAVNAATLLVPFFLFDLLTAIFSSSMVVLFSYSIYMFTQPVATFRSTGLMNICGAAMMLVVAVYLSQKGREFGDEEVRPLYARLLDQRLRLQAEVSAAREAQIRLLPQTFPQTSDIKVTAACRPARVVGGDFYDVFKIDEERIGVFLAEGGGRGLEAAMTIAFAKGFLMPRVRANYSPGEMINQLQTQLLPMLGLGQNLMAAYAVINALEGTVTYARTGDYPKVLHLKHRLALKSGPDALPHEREIDCAEEASGGCLIRESSVALEPGDAFLLLTDRLYSEFEREGNASPARFVNKLTSRLSKDSVRDGVQSEVLNNLEGIAKRAKKDGREDDLTTVVIYHQTKMADKS